ncbi:MAG TPA: PAS domain-containing protein [Sphingomonas sp.]|jgi:PAS domain S-box-containing protein|nr:PAS domain-containing protein [Sphingomonas sp.]
MPPPSVPPPSVPPLSVPEGAEALDAATCRSLADNLPTCCWIANADGYVVWYNRRWHMHFGTTPAQMEGWGWRTVYDPADVPAIVANWTASVATGEPFEQTMPMRGADGAYRPFLTRAQPMRDADGAVMRWFGTTTDVSEEVAMRDNLRAERDRHRQVLENMGEGFLLLDADFTIRAANAEAERLAQIPRAALLGRTVWQVWPYLEDSPTAVLQKRMMAERTRGEIEHRVVRADGEEVWLDLRAFPSGDGLAVFYRDVTERKRAAALLADSEARFRAAAETMPGFVWTADEDGAMEYASPAWALYAGVDPEGSMRRGGGWGDYIHADDVAPVYDAWSEAVATKRPYEAEFRLRRRDGSYRWWLARARWSGGRWVGTSTDVDHLVAARDNLAQSRGQLAKLVEDRTAERDRLWRFIPDLLMTATLDGRLLSVNPAWTDVLGHDEATLLAEPVWGLLHPDDLFPEDLVELRAGRGVRRQNRLRTAAGAYRWFDWVCTPEGDTFYAIARDITERKAKESELAEAQDALRQSQKMEAVGQLTGGVAHDFNNLLTVIRGSIELLQRPEIGEERRQRYLSAISDTADRATKLTGQLLAFARRQRLTPEVFDVGASLDALLDMIRSLTGARIEVVLDVRDRPCFINADRGQLDTAIINMAVNARDAMAGRGTLTIVAALADAVPSARGSAAVPGRFLTIAVGDTGTGIAPQALERIFEPFFTTKDVGHGTGLGLSQVFGFAKQSGGDIVVESRVGAGATFTLYLPAVDGGDAVPRIEDVPRPDASDARACILVVEDNAAVGRFATSALADLGHETVLATDGITALAELKGQADRFDLVFSDVMMPGMSGIDLAREIAKRHPGLPVILASGYSSVLANGGADGLTLIQKPYSVDTLAQAVRNGARRR